MAIYRAEQARVSFASEPGHGGYTDFISASTQSGWSGTVNGAVTAGSRSFAFDGGSGTVAVDQYIRIGSVGTATGGGFNAEIRKVTKVDGATVYVDHPFGFHHLDNEAVSQTTIASAITGDSLLTFLPGVYDAVACPDLTPEITPYYFMSTSGNRNWTMAYRGRQTFNGSIGNMLLLNGYPIRFPIGSVATTGTDVGSGGGSTLSGATSKGHIEITVADATNYAAGDYIQIDTSTNSEVRQIVAVNSAKLRLNYPLMIAHATGVACNEVTSPYTHTIVEQAELDSVAWNVLFRDSSETAANDFIRRYVGGMVGNATFSADEGGMLRFSWGGVNFLDMAHNQYSMSGVSGEVQKASRALIDPTVEAGATDNVGIGGARPRSGSDLGNATYPTTEPYYFSQGALYFFGVPFARIRSFSIDINNNLEPRFYLNDNGSGRIVSEIQEQRRNYSMTASIAMEDSIASSANTRTLWKELILEGNYGSGMQGFDIHMTFTRGTNDTIVIKSPSNATTANGGAAAGFGTQGCFLTSAPHPVGGDSPVQIDASILMRDLSIVITDSEGVYP